MITIKKALVSAGFALSTFACCSSFGAPLDGDDWLHTQGNQIVDKDGNPVWLTGANWFGFNATERTFHGLWSVNLESTLQTLAVRGINILRVPISTELLWEWRNGVFSIPGINGSTNSGLVGKTDLQIFDRFLEVARELGMKVMLDVHSAEADNSGHFYPLWYKDSITPEIFYQAWGWVTERYKTDDTIIAMDIQNEPHGKPWADAQFAKWDGSSDINNFKYACETASNRILNINPNMLVLCEGVESYPRDGVTWNGTAGTEYFNTWWGGNLRGVRDHPIDLGSNQDQLIYSPHDYGPLVFRQNWFFDGFTRETLQRDAWNDNWLFIHDEGIAPLLIGEWGGFIDGADNQKWMEALRDQIVEDRLHHTFWAVNPNSGDTGGLLQNDWITIDEEKYVILKPALWQNEDGKFVSLDHEVPLGSSATSVSLSEFYGNQQPSVGITSPSEGTAFTIGTSFNLSFGVNQVSGVNTYVNNTLVSSNSTSSPISINVPTSEGPFSIRLEAVDQNGDEIGIQAIRAFNAVAEVVLLPSVSISSPISDSELLAGQTFLLTVTYENAAGFKVEFAGQSQTVLNNSSISLSAPTAPNSYPLTVTAVDGNQQNLDATASVNLIVNETQNGSDIACEVSLPNIWPGGFTINELEVRNNSDTAISSWSVMLNLAPNVSLVNGWNAVFDGSTDTITITNAPYNGNIPPNQSVTFGFQGAYSGGFIVPTCSTN